MDVLVISILTDTGRKPLSEKGIYLNGIQEINLWDRKHFWFYYSDHILYPFKGFLIQCIKIDWFIFDR